MSRKSPWQVLECKGMFFWLGCLGFLFKYWLVLGEEIEPFFRPADDLNYILLGKGWYFWAEYNVHTLLRQPVYPLFLALVNVSEIPLRLVQEFLLCGSAFFILNGFRKAGLNPTIAGLTFVVVILHPGWLLLANRTLRECFYTSMWLITVGALIPLTLQKVSALKLRQVLPGGVALALLWHTREETILVGLFLLGYLFLFWVLPRDRRLWKIRGKPLVALLVGLIAPIALTNLTIRSMNYFQHRMFVSHELQDSGMRTMYKRLQQIKPANPKPWVNIERECLEKAYAVSPTLSSIREAFSERVGPRWGAVTQHLARDEEEIGGGAFLIGLREAASEEGIHASALKAREFYDKVAAEIGEGFASGKLEKRFVFHPYVDPEISDYLPRFPGGLLHVAKFAYQPLKDTDMRIYYPRHEVFTTLEAYDEVANRRHHIAYRKVPVARGWAFTEGGRISGVELIDHNGIILESTTDIADRPDVMEAYREQNAPLASGFILPLPKADYLSQNVTVAFKTDDGNTFSLPASRLLDLGQIQVTDDKGKFLRVTIDEIKSGRDEFRAQERIQAWLWIHHGKFHVLFFAAALILWSIRLILSGTRGTGCEHMGWIGTLGIIIGTRWFLITLIQVSSFHIDLRYIFPALVFIPVLFALCMQQAVNGIPVNKVRRPR